ncbi:hypothetical protein H0264_14615 [Nocardia huaxiensis]|uniref:Uncharacterized protein n=1 Tax=Nocardia huaxiensis TaxID=2755382 RepID=A0A7D6ZMM1_9NOCA|nr:hypothetical protein [Nocardia huaxiensis]QLY33300.1 hypothetical protein H0264_14615 [Nocardia huaxiensis]
MATSTTAAEVINHFTALGTKTQSELDRWIARPSREHVAETVLAHVTRTPYIIAADDIATLRTAHPLGEIRPEQAYRIPGIKNWYPAYAFTHLFHQMLEEHGKVFTWNEFRDWAQAPKVRDRLWEPAQEQIRTVVRNGADAAVAHAAMQWRIGIFYYSFLRELYVIARFREHGLAMLCHPLADALFRADTWCNNVIVELYIPNPTFKTVTAGRKFKTRTYFADQPQFDVVELTMPAQHSFGELHVPAPETIEHAAARIQTALHRSHAA